MRKLFPLRIILGWLPAILIIFWGLTYLRVMALTILGPGEPVTFELPTPGGLITIKARSYNISIRKGLATASGVQIFDPHQNLLASGKQVLVQFPANAPTKGPYKIRLVDTYVSLKRNKDGKFSFQSYLPKPSGQPSNVSFSISAFNVRGTYVDQTLTPQIEQSFFSPALRFDKSGSDWTSSSQIALQNVGDLTLQLGDVHEAINGEFKTSGIKLSPSMLSLAKLLPTPAQNALKPISFQSIQFSGIGNFSLAPNQPLMLQSSLIFSANGLQYQNWHASKLTGSGKLTTDTFVGNVNVNDSNTNIKCSGDIDWAGGFNADGTYEVMSKDLKSLFAVLPVSMPSGLQADGLTSRGVIHFSEPKGIHLGGKFEASKARYQNGSNKSFSKVDGRNLNGSYIYDNDKVKFTGEAVTHQLGSVTSAGTYNLQNQDLEAQIHAPNLSLAEAQKMGKMEAKTFGTLQGSASVTVNLNGPISNLQANFRANGSGTYREPKAQWNPPAPIDLTGLAALGSFAHNQLHLDRVWLKSSAGTSWGSADFNLASQRIEGKFESRGIDLSQILAGVRGLAVSEGTIAGTMESPSIDGKVEVYNLQYDKFQGALLKGEVHASKNQLEMNHVVALKGSSFASGNLALAFPSQKISGSIQSKGISLYDLFGAGFGGRLSVSADHLAGTLQNPVVQLSGIGAHLVVKDMPVDAAYFRGEYKDGKFHLGELNLNAASGYAKVTGDYDVAKDLGTLTASISGVNLNEILPIYVKNNDLVLNGVAAGTASASFGSTGLINADSSGTISDVVINGAGEGQGIWSLNALGNQFNGSLQISDKDKFISVENGQFNADSGNYSANVLLNRVPIQDAFTAALPVISKQYPNSVSQWKSLDGEIQLGTKLAGNLSHPKQFVLSVPEANFTSLVYHGVTLGGVQLSGQYSNRKAILNTFFYQDGATVGSMNGTYDLDGASNIEANFANIDLAKVSALLPNSPKLTGSASAAALISGESSNPDLRASLNIEHAKTGAIPSVFGLSLDDIEAHDGKFTIGGNLSYNGFVGTIDGSTTYDPKHGINEDAPINVNIAFAKRPISDLAEYSPLIDGKEAKGSFEGNASLRGTLKEPELTADAKLNASELGFVQPFIVSGSKKSVPFATHLNNANLDISLSKGILLGNISAKSSDSGSVQGSVKADFSALLPELGNPSSITKYQILRSQLGGEIHFNQLSANEKTNLVNAKASLDGDLNFGGTLRHPTIGGNLVVNNLDTTMPTIATSTGQPSKPIIDPQFNIQATIGPKATIRTSLASIDLNGTAQLGGTLSSPNVNANLAVAGGSLRLPGGNVRLEKGGTVKAVYSMDATGNTNARVDVALNAETRIVAAQMTGNLERYDITLNVNGDLLNPDQVQFTASSDPPDLNQNQILAILGRTDILTALGSGSSFNQTREALTGVLAGYALPGLLDPFTKGLAQGLGLDFVNIEYNQFSQASIVIGKNFGGGLSFIGTRQISEPAPGFPQFYDYRLQYRPSFFSGKLRHLAFIFGQDQNTPWKLGIQYGIQF